MEKSHDSLQTQATTKCFLRKQKLFHGTKKMKKLSITCSNSIDFTDNIKYIVKDCRLAFAFNSINFRIHCFFLSTLPALNDLLQEYYFVMTIMGDFSTTEKLQNNHFMTMSLIFLRITKMKQLIKFL